MNDMVKEARTPTITFVVAMMRTMKDENKPTKMPVMALLTRICVKKKNAHYVNFNIFCSSTYSVLTKNRDETDPF